MLIEPEPSPPTPPSRWEFRQRVLEAAAIVLLVAAVALLGWAAWEILLLIFAGILAALFLGGLAGFVSRMTGLRNGWSLAIVAAVIVGLVWMGYLLLAPKVNQQANELWKTLPASVESLRTSLEKSDFGKWISQQAADSGNWITSRRALLRATTLLSTTVGAAAGLVVILATGFYLASEPAFYIEGALRLLPPARRARSREVLHAVGGTLQWWLIGQACSMTLIGTLTWLGLWALGIPLALCLGLIAGLLTFIPNIGPIVSVAPALLLALAQSPDKAGYVILLYLGIHAVEGYVATPLIQRRIIRMPPALTLSAQLLMGATMGVLGLTLATPLTAAIMVLTGKLYVSAVLENPPGAE